jgi:hypothetical protein
VILIKWNSGLQPLQSHIKHSATKDRGSIKRAPCLLEQQGVDYAQGYYVSKPIRDPLDLGHVKGLE